VNTNTPSPHTMFWLGRLLPGSTEPTKVPLMDVCVWGGGSTMSVVCVCAPTDVDVVFVCVCLSLSLSAQRNYRIAYAATFIGLLLLVTAIAIPDTPGNRVMKVPAHTHTGPHTQTHFHSTNTPTQVILAVIGGILFLHGGIRWWRIK